MAAPSPRLLLAGLRGSLALGWLAPNAMAGLFGVDPANEPTLPYLLRLFAVREGALAALAVAAPAGQARRLVLQAGVAVDSIDTLAALIAGGQRKASWFSATLAAGTAAGAAALGVAALRDPQR